MAWQRLPWPLPALGVWAGGWLLWALLGSVGLAAAVAFGMALAVTTVVALRCRSRWRQAIAASGFPLSAMALGVAGALPPWIWLLLLLPVLALYPLRAWSDAPLFPTPDDALAGLDAIVGRPRRVHDAGCGLGHGLSALHRLWPQAELSGSEWSPLLAWATRRRCRHAQVRRGDMWAIPWADYDLVYLFQRPESMGRAHAKAARELAPGAWLVSLEFAVPDAVPVACVQCGDRKPLWVYQPAGPAAPSIPPGLGR
ncbi:MAG: class I SAM-dependent methyltransferase [Betaproteobacteria bacterium]|nr:class I SAM-dependent methyltransferase [Betaproteobacteria bacterium]